MARPRSKGLSKELKKQCTESLKRAIKNVGGISRLGELIGELPQTIQGWIYRGATPPEKVIIVEKASGEPRWKLRPDVYPPEEYKGKDE